MNADRLLTHFDRLAEAPDAIPRLRRFILDLAVRGKLVERDPNDGSVDSAAGGTSSEAEWPYPIPNGWTWQRIPNLASLVTDGEYATPSRISEKEVPLVTAKNVRDGQMDYGNTDWVSFATAEKAWARCKPLPGDILVVCVGATIGRLCVLREPRDMVLVRSVALIRPRKGVLADYLGIAIRSPLGQGQIWRNVKMAAQPCLYLNRINSLVFPLPSLIEQRLIITKVNEMMALCDRLEAAQAEREQRRDRLVTASLRQLQTQEGVTPRRQARQESQDNSFFSLASLAPWREPIFLRDIPRLTTRPEHIKGLRQAILNLAVRGKLVNQDLKDEPVRLGAELLEPVPTGLPHSWRYSSLEHLLAENTRNGYSRKPDDAPGGVPILRISAGTARRDGIVAEEEHKRISGIDSATRVQYGLEAGDLLACRFNGNKSFVGRLTLFKDYLGISPIFPDKLIRVRLNSVLADPAYVRQAGDSDLVRASIENSCATTVGNWGISASNLKEIAFPVPPLAEQRRIVAKVDELMAVCDQLEAQLTETRADSRRLLESVLRDALA